MTAFSSATSITAEIWLVAFTNAEKRERGYLIRQGRNWIHSTLQGFATAGCKRCWPIKINPAWPQENNWWRLNPGKCAVQVPSLTPHKLLTHLDVFLFLTKLISAPNTFCQRKKSRKTKTKPSNQNKFCFFPWVFLTFSGSQEISTWYKFPFPPSHVVLLSRYTSCPTLTAHFIHDTSAGKPEVRDLAWLHKCRRISWERTSKIMFSSYCPTVPI